MTTRSAKAKGRRAQNEVAQSLRECIYLPHGCHEDDVKPVTMGISGMDIILTPAARRVFDLINETKNVEKLNVVTTFHQHYDKYADKPGLKILTHRKNKSPMLATLRWDDFVSILKEAINARVTRSTATQD